MSSLRVGIQLPEVEREVRWPEVAAMARAAEEVGFDSIWLGDHLLYRGDGRPERGPWEAWTLLAALAAATERVRLGPLVACASFHPPGLIAKMAATLAEVSGGRFVLGLGAGWNEVEYRAFALVRVIGHAGADHDGEVERPLPLHPIGDVQVAALGEAHLGQLHEGALRIQREDPTQRADRRFGDRAQDEDGLVGTGFRQGPQV